MIIFRNNLKKIFREEIGKNEDRKKFIRLDKNERNYQFQNKIINSIKKNIFSDCIQSYPTEYNKLLNLIAIREKLNKEYIEITPGADGAIKYIFELFSLSNYKIKFSTIFPTYGMIEVYAKIYGFEIIKEKKELFKNFEIDKLIKNNINFIYLANPNQPDGEILKENLILKFLSKLKKKKIFLILDETYIEFSHQKTMSNYVKKNKNLIIVKSFSKSLGVAGLRVGYVIAHSKIISMIKKIKPLSDISSLSLSIVHQLLLNKKFKLNYLNEIKKSKIYVRNECKKLNFNLVETETNFFHLIFNKRSNQLYNFLKKKNILVRKNLLIINGVETNTLRITYSNKIKMKLLFKLLKIFFNL